MIEAAVHTRLLEDPAVAALVADRISPAPMGQVGDPAIDLPAITFQRISRVTHLLYDGTIGPHRPRIQLDSWASLYAEAKAVAKAVETSLLGFRGPIGAANVLGIFLDNDQDLYEPDVKLHRVRADYLVWCSES